MILRHFSEEPLKFDPRRTYPKAGTHKPIGFWLSDERDKGWKDWCESAEFRLEGLKHSSDFECDLSDWIVLDTLAKLDAFTSKFKQKLFDNQFNWIDWSVVQPTAKGIVISPYQFAAHNSIHNFWYYGWDCASACVWDLSSIRPLRLPHPL